MNKFFVSVMIMLSGMGAVAAETRLLGNVVAEERTFNVDFNECLKTFKQMNYSSSCRFVDASVKSVDTDLVIGELPYVGEKIPHGTGNIDITLAGNKDGWMAVFSVDTEISSRSMSTEEARSYFNRLKDKVNGQLKVQVYTIK